MTSASAVVQALKSAYALPKIYNNKNQKSSAYLDDYKSGKIDQKYLSHDAHLPH